MPDFGLSGLASGFDWRTFIDQVLDLQRAPQRRLLVEQGVIESRQNAYASITTELGVLRNHVETLSDAALFDSRTANSSDSTVATATVAEGAAAGAYTFDFLQLATTARRHGTANAGSRLSATSDVSGVVLSSAPLAQAVTAGTFTVNGQTVTLATSDTLQGVFDKISAATSGAVTGSYDPATDKATLSSATEIVLGSATDTSNFLQSFKLGNNGTGTVTSSAALGVVKQAASLSAANFTTAVSDGGAGAGQFKINGVEISFSVSDSVATVLDRINASAAGVTASYDSVNDRFALTNKTTGDIGIALQDVTGNFLTASGLAGGSLERGKNLLYTVNGGGQLSSFSNTITETSSGIAGLSVTALKDDAVTLTVSSDATRIRKAVTDFVDAYNRVQGLIDTSTASTTNADGDVTAGVLASEREAIDLASRLRALVNATVSDLGGALTRLEALGITSNGDDDKLALTDSAALDAALADNLADVQDLFAHDTLGLAVQLDAFLETAIGDEGNLVSHQDTLAEQIADIDTQITDQERLVQTERERLIASFVAMEEAQARINQQLQFLLQRFGSGSR